MIGHRMRKLGLLLAVWAFLLAPGALGTEGDDVAEAPDSEHLAAAVLAPTLGSESFLGNRSCDPVGDDADETCAVLGGTVPATAEFGGERWTVALVGTGGIPTGTVGRKLPARAPPTF